MFAIYSSPTGLNRLFRFLWWLLCWLAWLLPSPAVAADQTAVTAAVSPAHSLAEALRPDGSLRPGVQGSFDARQFRLAIAPDGRPRFYPARVAGAGDAGWQPAFRAAGPNYTVHAVVQLGTSLYVGGEFSTVGGTVAHNVARWDGTSWSALGTGTNGTVNALALVGTDLYVAGRFSQAGGAPAASIAKWNGTSWSALGAGLANAGSTQLAYVATLLSVGQAVYAGGTFTLAGGASANNIARWDGSSWSPLGAGLTGTIGSVNALAMVGADLYVGGSFDYAGGQVASRIAKWNGTSWQALGSGIGTATNGTVDALLVVGSDLYVGGGFGVAGGVATDGLAKWNGTSWSRLGGAGFANGHSNGIVTAMALVGTDLYITGYFQQAYGAVADYLAKWDGTTWTGVGGGLDGVSLGVAHTLLVTGSNVYVGGRFSRAGGVRADNLAKWNGTNWSSVGEATTNVQGLDQPIFALAAAGSALYAGGSFRQAGSAAAEGLTQWDGSSWTSFYTGAFTGTQVYAVAVAGSAVYVGGRFYTAGTAAANNVAKWDGTTWSSLGTGSNNGVNGTVSALAMLGPDLYVGGSFTQAGGQAANCIARWNGTTWSTLGTGATNGVMHPSYTLVQALAVLGPDLYVGGQFTSAGGTSVVNLARWNGKSWSSLGASLNGTVYALTTAGSRLYAGGIFTLAGGQPVNRVAVWDGQAWSSLGTGAANGVTSTSGITSVEALAVAGNDVYVGGRFTQAGGVSALNVAHWNGTAWSSLGTGTNGEVRALAVLGGRVYAGGYFTAVGDESQVMNYFGSFDPAQTLATASGSARALTMLYPNPATGGAVTWALPSASTTRSVQLLDGLGRLTGNWLLPAGSNSLTVPTQGLPAGSYLLRCGPLTQRLVIP